jgi:hypothetical protein
LKVAELFKKPSTDMVEGFCGNSVKGNLGRADGQ